MGCEKVLVPYYPAYNAHPIDNTHPPPQVPFPYVKYNVLFITRRRSWGVGILTPVP